MKTRIVALLALAGIAGGAITAEQIFLSRLEHSVIHDDARIQAFLKSLHYPIWVQPGFGFCRPGGSSWGYEYQLCIFQIGTPPECPRPAYTLQYLGPQSTFALISRDYHDDELMFRVRIFDIDKFGLVCRDKRGE